MDASGNPVNEIVEEIKLTKDQRFYWRHREELLEKQRERKREWYNNRPDVIAAREERARAKEEREKKKAEEMEAKRVAKKKLREERTRAVLAATGLSPGASKD